jgi:NAD(P)-dependent dehydrogenase (short-subunit alcohol dehydrogenase family)
MGATYPDLRGKTVVITGGASGIGASLVEAFAGQGARVGFLDIDAGRGRALTDRLSADGGEVRFEEADLKDIAALKAAIGRIRDAFGPITGLVNNAAHDERHQTLEVTPEYFDERIATNFRHQFFASQAVIPDMQAAGGGAIICMGSFAWIAGFGGMPVYNASKSAVLGLARSLARDFGPDNVRVNMIAPGWIMTERQLELWINPETAAMRDERQALKRPLVPDDIAKVALFLISDESSAITAQHYVVDGGWV